jgi:hypothetical protein
LNELDVPYAYSHPSCIAHPSTYSRATKKMAATSASFTAGRTTPGQIHAQAAMWDDRATVQEQPAWMHDQIHLAGNSVRQSTVALVSPPDEFSSGTVGKVSSTAPEATATDLTGATVTMGFCSAAWTVSETASNQAVARKIFNTLVVIVR